MDVIFPGQPIWNLHIIMRGVFLVYLPLLNGEELALDYLGPGSIIGQYSFLTQEYSVFGYRCVSEPDGSLLVLSSSSMKYLAKTHQSLRTAIESVNMEVKRNGVPEIDFVRFNDNSPL